MLVPKIATISYPRSTIPSITPAWTNPFAPPPPRTRLTCLFTNRRVTSSARMPPWHCRDIPGDRRVGQARDAAAAVDDLHLHVGELRHAPRARGNDQREGGMRRLRVPREN